MLCYSVHGQGRVEVVLWVNNMGSTFRPACSNGPWAGDTVLLLTCMCQSGWEARAVRPRGWRWVVRHPPSPRQTGRWHPVQGAQFNRGFLATPEPMSV